MWNKERRTGIGVLSPFPSHLSSGERVDVSALFGVGNLVDFNKDTALFYIAKLMVDSSSKHAHGG